MYVTVLLKPPNIHLWLKKIRQGKPHKRVRSWINIIKDINSKSRKVMTNLNNVLKSRDITLLTKVHLVKGMVSLVVMYRCESWTIKKAECQRTDAFFFFQGRILKIIYSWIWNGFPLPQSPHTWWQEEKMANSGVWSYYAVMVQFSNQSTDHNKEDANINELNMITFKKFIKIGPFLWKRIWSMTSDKNNSTVLSYNVYFMALCLQRRAS